MYNKYNILCICLSGQVRNGRAGKITQTVSRELQHGGVLCSPGYSNGISLSPSQHRVFRETRLVKVNVLIVVSSDKSKITEIYNI